MNFGFTEEQEEISNTAARLMDEVSTHDRVEALMATERGWDETEWRRIAELGWTGMHLPEEHGGAGLTQVELMIVMERMGAALFCSPFFATVCLAANVLLESGDDTHAALLSEIATGGRTATLALTEPGGGWDAASVRLTARRDGGDWVLDGRKSFVVDGHTADTVLVVAREGGAGAEGVSLFAAPGESAGLDRPLAHALDETRKLATLDFDGVRLPADALVGEAGGAWPAIDRALLLASVALTAEMAGAARHCFDVALAYTLDRYQFGRPIASFQAIKHKCADLLALVEQSRSAAYYAGWVATNDRQRLAATATLAKAYVGDAFWRVAKENIQLHGGIGFTWEHEAHLYYRRARSSRVMFGDSDAQRARLLTEIGV